MTVPERLRAARERLGLTQEEAADAIGVTQPAIAQWESGEASPRSDRLRTIARVYGLRAIDLLPCESAA